jgi:hypothetical protein
MSTGRMLETRIGRFDQVRIITTKNVTYLSAPPGTNTSPKGIWSVVSIVNGNELLLAKNSILIRIPATDVLLVVSYNLENISKSLGNLSNGQEERKAASFSNAEQG